MTCLPAGIEGSSATFSASRCVAHGAMPSALRISSSRRHPDLARVERSRCARRTVRRSGSPAARAFLLILAGGVRTHFTASLRAAGRFETSVPEFTSAASTFHFVSAMTLAMAMARAALSAPATPVTNGLDGAQPAALMKRGGTGRQRSASALFERLGDSERSASGARCGRH